LGYFSFRINCGWLLPQLWLGVTPLETSELYRIVESPKQLLRMQ